MSIEPPKVTISRIAPTEEWPEVKRIRERLAGENLVFRGGYLGEELAGFIAVLPTLRYLDRIEVRREIWGTGVAMALMTEARRICPQGLALEVDQGNVRALRFYAKLGFKRLRPGRSRQGSPV